MNRTKNGFVLAALSLSMLGAAGCANLQPPPPAPAPALAPLPAPASAPAAQEVRTSLEFGGVLVSIYHPDTRVLYLWSGDPRPNSRRPMTCIKMQLTDAPSGAPKSSPCP